MKKRCCIILMAVCMALCITSSFAEGANYSGSCGENTSWTYDEASKTLTVSGSGPISSYKANGCGPWKDFVGEIERITIGEGITGIGFSAFQGCYSLKQLELPDSLLAIDQNAFYHCDRSLDRVIIPENVYYIGCNAFSGWTSCEPPHVTYAYFLGDVPKTLKDAGKISNSFSEYTTLYYLPEKSGWTGATVNGYHIEPWDGIHMKDKNYTENNSVGFDSSFTDVPTGAQAIIASDGKTYDRILRALVFQPADRQAVLTLETDIQLTGFSVVLGTSDYNGMFSFETETYTVPPHDVVIDLNGHTITSEVDYPLFEVQDGYTLTILDSSAAKTGRLVTQGETDVLVREGGKYIPLPAPAEPDEPAAPDEPAQPAEAAPTNDRLTVNGALRDPTVYKINDNNYFKIRDLAAVLNGTEKQFDVDYDGALQSVTATTGQPYRANGSELAGAAAGGGQTADPSNDAIYIDGQRTDAVVYKINGSNYFKLRDLGRALDFYVGWTQEEGVFIDTTRPYSE